MPACRLEKLYLSNPVRQQTPALLLMMVFWVAGCERNAPAAIEAMPAAAQHPVIHLWHGEQIEDPYQYLAEPDHPDTRAYIRAERQWFARHVAQWTSVRSQMADALDSYLTTNVKSVPLSVGEYEIYNKQGRGEQYPVFYRRHVATNEVQVLLDVNELAAGAPYYRLGGFSVNTGANLIAYTQDRTGDERYTLRVKDLITGDVLPVSVDAVGASIAWLGQHILYIAAEQSVAASLDPMTGQRETLYREADPQFVLSLTDIATGNVLLTSESADAVEIRLFRPGQKTTLIAPRRAGHRYRVQVRAGEMTLLSNARSPDYELATAPLDVTSVAQFEWIESVSGQLLDFERVQTTIAVHLRQALVQSIAVHDLETGETSNIVQQAPGETLQLLPADTASGEFRYQINGLNRPTETYQYNRLTGVSQLIARSPVPAGFDAARYQTEQRWISARDGTDVPVTLFYQRTLKAADADLSQRPLLMTAYGAYGISVNPRFEPWRFPLLDQGIIFALAHVRGGADLGQNWHAKGSGQFAKNSVNDLVDVTRGLLADGVGDRRFVFARGVSAGGTLIAAALNQAPELFAAVILKSAFLDMLNTLGHNNGQINAGDTDEWGDPLEASEFDAIRALSPYENLPSTWRADVLMLVAANDQRVGLHESLKWLARARARQPGGNLMLIDIDNDSGHLGATDQYKLRRQVTLEYSFLLNRLATGD